jgi:hypothetical protein
VPEDGTTPFGSRDLYERRGNETTLLTDGPTGQGSEINGNTVVSTDGSHVYFHSSAQLVPTDTDDDRDLYVAKVADPARYVRPKSASTIQVPLVPSAQPCSSPNRMHGPPLAFGSCAPVVSASPDLTVGVGGGDPAPAKSVGLVRMDVQGIPGGSDDSDVRLGLDLTNVMNDSDLTDYTGELRASVQVRLTDRVAGISGTTDLSFGFTAPCTGTADTTIGGHCAVVTTADAVLPGAIPEGARAIWELGKVQVYDGGPDQNAETPGDNSLFATQGVFVQ